MRRSTSSQKITIAGAGASQPVELGPSASFVLVAAATIASGTIVVQPQACIGGRWADYGDAITVSAEEPESAIVEIPNRCFRSLRMKVTANTAVDSEAASVPLDWHFESPPAA
ncbi:hypothetical protein H5P28_11820 [Ruficoccus amylovorans]|uniref:Uncharacterized protein n=1 Tax=Ruficoccus amylovorans TaxID=1804625 RepID=A0A842HED6_9BACT|nr:hypothetical protein [Ruficoccus amylovorans]MBC2594945.1 hypothetical protein [Ruficoccus amylovorans]